MYRTLGFILTATCTASCKMCSLSCSPFSKEKLDVERIKFLIRSSKDTTIKHIAISGGEPFLYFEDLLEIVSVAKEVGKTSNIVTNGFWANDCSTTYKKIKSLKNAGLSSLNFSYDNYHADFVAKENIKLGISVCNDLNLPYLVAMCKTQSETLGSLIDSLTSDSPSTNILINKCLPVGNALQNISATEFSRDVKPKNLKCPNDGLLIVHYSGKVFPCCSHYVFSSNLSLGNYQDSDIPTFLNKVKNNSLLYLLRNYGLDSLVTKYSKKALQGKDLFCSPCEICHNLFSTDFSDMKPTINEILRNGSPI